VYIKLPPLASFAGLGYFVFFTQQDVQENRCMATIMPQSELLRRAVAYVSEERGDNPGKRLSEILDDASMRFNLSPLDSEALYRLFSNDNSPDNGQL
jgi:hypothetical protein